MNKQAFKQRMQLLKLYREQNPGKTYLDWKQQLPDNLQDESNYNLKRAYELGYEPETVEGDSLKHLPTRDSLTGEILKKPWHPTFLIGLLEDAKLGYYPLTKDGTTYTTTWEGNENPIYKYADGGEVGNGNVNSFQPERDWLSNFAKKRAELPEFADLLDEDQLSKYLFRVNNTPVRTTSRSLPSNAAGMTSYDTSSNVPYDSLDFYKAKTAVVVADDPTYGGANQVPYSKDLNSNVIHELDHTTQVSTAYGANNKEGFSKRVQKVADIMGTDLDKTLGEYSAQPWEVLSRRQLLFHEINADPSKKYDKKDIKSMKDQLKKYNLDFLGDDKVMQLFNDVASNNTTTNLDDIFHAADGGEVKKDSVNTPRQELLDIANAPMKLASWNTPSKLAEVQYKFKPNTKGFGMLSALDLIDLAADEYEIHKSADPKQTRRYRDYLSRSAIGLEDQGLEKLYSSTPKMSEGGEIKDETTDHPILKPIIPADPIPYKGTLYKDFFGRKYTEELMYDYMQNSTDEISRFTRRPMVRGLKPLLDIEDAANLTPVGDAISLYDAYGAAKNKDWGNVGLALLPLLPFVPRTGKGISKATIRAEKRAANEAERQLLGRKVPTVNREYVDRQLDKAVELKKAPETDFNITDLADGYNARNRIIEDIDDDAIRKAREMDKLYGTNYERTYNDLITTYQNDYFNLNDVEYNPVINRERPGAQAKMALNDESKFDIETGGRPIGKRDYTILLNPYSDEITKSTMLHEMGHLTDRMASEVGSITQPNVFPTNAMLEKLSHNSNFLDYNYFAKNNRKMSKKEYEDYLHMGTEIKSFMNATRRSLFESGKIKRLTADIDLDTVQDYMKTLDSTKSEKNLFDSFKKPSEYIKWINSIPVLGLGAAAMYVNRNELK